MRPKSPGLKMRPVRESMLPPVASTVLMSLIGLLRFGWLNKLKKTTRISRLDDSRIGQRFSSEKSTQLWPAQASGYTMDRLVTRILDVASSRYLPIHPSVLEVLNEYLSIESARSIWRSIQ